MMLNSIDCNEFYDKHTLYGGLDNTVNSMLISFNLLEKNKSFPSMIGAPEEIIEVRDVIESNPDALA
jgi:hypothetical protein